MIARTFLAHFDDPFRKPVTSCHGVPVARKWTAGFLESIPGRVKCRSQNRDRLRIKGAVLLKERNNRHRPSPSWRHLSGKTNPPPPVADPSATSRTTLCV